MSDGSTSAAFDPNVVDADPTKEFFLFMLTKDVPLKRAILDLVDNSVDAAVRAAKKAGASTYEAYSIEIDTKPDAFSIVDNCGGISVDVARRVAFRFGRPADVPEALLDPSNIGQFGVGMKRTMFKLGTAFKVTSTTATSHFVVSANVATWIKERSWAFAFDPLIEADQDPKDIGTTVEVSPLYPSIAEEFALANFRKELGEEISLAHAYPLRRGIRIKLNGIQLEGRSLELLQSDTLRPACRVLELPGGVHVKIFAGVHNERRYDEGGWYVFCHQRMVLGPDQTTITGWGDELERIAQYHADFAYFRGYVFFDAEHTALLPWTTTKTGIDTDAAAYRRTKQEMIAIVRPVLEYLRQLAREKSAVENEGVDTHPLTDAMETAAPVDLDVLPPIPFQAPRPAKKSARSSYQKIQYERPRTRVDEVKRQLGVTTFKEVGEGTFDYYYSAECE